ncbi:hypothetical protein [Marinomonas atlantica]|uniref:hypothetical protein n=1 Tax=Marinomonas atlantica TaxID=1806668 RepID=UPI0008361AD9|nr:hypothetical protein [Marinomonas atlantica]
MLSPANKGIEKNSLEYVRTITNIRYTAPYTVPEGHTAFVVAATSNTSGDYVSVNGNMLVYTSFSGATGSSSVLHKMRLNEGDVLSTNTDSCLAAVEEYKIV